MKTFSITILLTLFLSVSAYAYPQPYPPRVYYSPNPYSLNNSPDTYNTYAAPYAVPFSSSRAGLNTRIDRSNYPR